MNIFDNNHNANLLNTLPESSAIVNINNPVIKYVTRLDNTFDSALYEVDYAPSKLFVKIMNSILDFRLKPKLLEFYCLMSYLCNALPDTELPILTIQKLIIHYTGININKNTINTHLKDLIAMGLITRCGKFYDIREPSAQRVTPPLTRRCTEGAEVAPIARSLDDNQNESKSNKNYYHNPKKNFTPFFITFYNTDTVFGSAAVEMYLASKAYDYHHPEVVCYDLSISRKTYYKYLNILLKKKIVSKFKINYKKNLYTNSYRLILWKDYEAVMESRYENKGESWRIAKEKARHRRLLSGKTKTAKSRIWYQSSMGRIMKDYGINYIKTFDNYDPDDAYLIFQELENQYRMTGSKLNAAMIVRGILDAYNWTKIVDRKHAKIKREQARDHARMMDTRYMMDYV